MQNKMRQLNLNKLTFFALYGAQIIGVANELEGWALRDGD